MKTFTGFFITIFMIAAVAFTAPTQEKNKNNKKDQQQNQGKNQDKGGQKKNNNAGNKGKSAEARDKSSNGNANRGQNKDRNEKENKGNSNSDNRGKNNKGGVAVYSWTPETFPERKKIRNSEKVTVCHKFNNSEEPSVTINVSTNAVQAHMNHGDVMGECPAITDNRFSDLFLTTRSDYYNTLQNGQEQIYYSQSILDYALQRLTNSRTQLVTLQNSNAPAAEIERKQAVVIELEQNASLLENLLGVAANLIVNKLQQ